MGERLLDLTVTALAVGLVAALSWWASASSGAEGLGPLVKARLGQSGVQSEVTAVLLNFRGLDTLFEVGVLLLAVAAAWSLHPVDRPSPVAIASLAAGPDVSPILQWFVERLAPIALLVAGYLWWAGSSIPGGAFQGGTVFGAALALLLLAGRIAPPEPDKLGYRLWACGGLLLFVAMALAPLAEDRPLLTYARDWNGILIVGLEAALTISIGACLAALVIGVPSAPPRRVAEVGP